jgi:hypothetical protein
MEETAMSQRVEPAPVLRLCSCLTGNAELLPEVEAALVRVFGEIALRSDPFPFDTSEYYHDEMGDGLERRWFCFQALCGAELLADTRLVTDNIEDAFSTGGKRRVNLDPGYLDFGKLVLASLKQAHDKIYLGRGVLAHTCLRYRAGDFVAPDHSFPDFQDGRFNSFMLRARKLYKSLLRD